MKTFVIADTHFGDENIIKYENRPFSNVASMTEAMTKNWNEKVSSEDVVYVLGDFSFYDKEKTEKIIRNLQGYKILVLGNHDKYSIREWLDMGFNEVSKYPIIVDEWIVMQHKPPEYYNNATPYFYLYGHVHATDLYKTITKKATCVCVERWDYTPIELDKIKKLVQEL